MKHMIMQSNKTSEIVIENNDTSIGKKRICWLVEQGFKKVGEIETELNKSELHKGISFQVQKQLDEVQETLSSIKRLIL